MTVIQSPDSSEFGTRPGQRGLSLLELLVAVAIASIMFLSMMQLITNASKSLNVLKKRIDMTQQARLVLERMTRELATAFHPYGMYPETSTRTPFPWLEIRNAGVGGKEISFVGMVHQLYENDEWRSPRNRVGDMVELHYHIVSVSGQTHLYRRIDEDKRLTTAAADKWTGGADVMIAQYVRTLNFEVWNKDGASVAVPFSYTGAELGFPSRVRIKVTFYDKDNVVDDMTFGVDVSTMRNTVTFP